MVRIFNKFFEFWSTLHNILNNSIHQKNDINLFEKITTIGNRSLNNFCEFQRGIQEQLYIYTKNKTFALILLSYFRIQLFAMNHKSQSQSKLLQDKLAKFRLMPPSLSISNNFPRSIITLISPIHWNLENKRIPGIMDLKGSKVKLVYQRI